jgi:hypothetical protein
MRVGIFILGLFSLVWLIWMLLPYPVKKFFSKKTPFEKLWEQYGKYGFSWAAWGEGHPEETDKWLDETNWGRPLVERVAYLLATTEKKLAVKVNHLSLGVQPDFLGDTPKRLRIEFPDGSTLDFPTFGGRAC